MNKQVVQIVRGFIQEEIPDDKEESTLGSHDVSRYQRRGLWVIKINNLLYHQRVLITNSLESHRQKRSQSFSSPVATQTFLIINSLFDDLFVLKLSRDERRVHNYSNYILCRACHFRVQWSRECTARISTTCHNRECWEDCVTKSKRREDFSISLNFESSQREICIISIKIDIKN